MVAPLVIVNATVSIAVVSVKRSRTAEGPTWYVTFWCVSGTIDSQSGASEVPANTVRALCVASPEGLSKAQPHSVSVVARVNSVSACALPLVVESLSHGWIPFAFDASCFAVPPRPKGPRVGREVTPEARAVPPILGVFRVSGRRHQRSSPHAPIIGALDARQLKQGPRNSRSASGVCATQSNFQVGPT